MKSGRMYRYGCVLGVVVMTAVELLERYAAGERDFSGISLRGANLIRANLQRINLSNAKLGRTLLIAANLSDSNLEGINLEGADLTRANLNRASLTNAVVNGDAIGTFFEQANLSNARMFRATLDGATFFQANLHRANLACTSLIGTRFLHANLRDADLQEARGVADFTEADLLNTIPDHPAEMKDFEKRLGTSIFYRTIMPNGTIRST